MKTEQNRPLSVAHLIFALIFGGIAAIWLIGEANDSDVTNLAAGFPAVLIGAGIIGLAASLYNVRRARARLMTTDAYPAPAETEDTFTSTEPVEDTVVLTNEKDES